MKDVRMLLQKDVNVTNLFGKQNQSGAGVAGAASAQHQEPLTC